MIAQPVTVTPLEGEPKVLSAAINGTDRNGVFRLSLRQPLAEGTTVRIAAGENYRATGRVLYSLPYKGWHYATIRILQDERRRDVRINISEPAQIISLQPELAAIECQASVSDVSKSGIGLVMSTPIPRDVLLKIVLDSAIIFGEVRHCTCRASEPGSFKVGVEVQTVIFRDNDEGRSKWSLSPRQLWTRLSVGFQLIVGRVRGESVRHQPAA